MIEENASFYNYISSIEFSLPNLGEISLFVTPIMLDIEARENATINSPVDSIDSVDFNLPTLGETSLSVTPVMLDIQA